MNEIRNAIQHPKIADLTGRDDAVVMLMASSWRSGSTLLQRMLMPNCFMWGEPYGQAWMIDSLTQVLRNFREGWPEKGVLYENGDPQDLGRRFIANLYPPPQSLLNAHCARSRFPTIGRVGMWSLMR